MIESKAAAAVLTEKIAPGTALQNARRIVVKVGSSLVTNEGRGLDATAIGDWCVQMAKLVTGGRTVPVRRVSC